MQEKESFILFSWAVRGFAKILSTKGKILLNFKDVV